MEKEHDDNDDNIPAFVVIDAKGQLRTPTMGYTTEVGMRLRLWWTSVLSLV